MPSPDRVLVLDGHTNQALACVRALGRAGVRVLVASPQRWPLAAWSRHCHARFHQAGETVAAFAALREWARARGVQVVLPLRERSCLLCNAERDAWETLGMAVGCGPTDMLLRAFDKARTLQLAQSCDVRIPPTHYPSSLAECHAAAAAVGFPCIVKPRSSDFWDGSRFLAEHGAQYVQDAAGLEESALAGRQGDSWPVIQGIVPGRGKGVFALYDHGAPVVWFAHERLRDVRPSGSGSSLRRSIPVDPRLQQPASRLLSAMAWHGPAMVEFRDDAPADYQTGVTLRWLWGDVKRLLYILAGPPPGCPEPYPGLLEGLREVLGPQPAGTASETWSADDPWPAAGEWVQGIAELAGVVRSRGARRVSEARAAGPSGNPGARASRPAEAVR